MAEELYSKEWFTEQFQRTGTTQADLFHAYQMRFGVEFDRTKISKMVSGSGKQRKPQLHEIPLIREFFGLDPEILESATILSKAASEVSIGKDQDFPNLGPRDVPVLQNAVGGQHGDLLFDGDIRDYIRRPPGLAGQRVFAAYVSGDSMSPRFEIGEPIYAYLARPAAPGDYVIVELRPAQEGGERRGFVKKLVRKTSAEVTCYQFNPPGEVVFPAKDVIRIYRVVPPAELLGA